MPRSPQCLPPLCDSAADIGAQATSDGNLYDVFDGSEAAAAFTATVPVDNDGSAYSMWEAITGTSATVSVPSTAGVPPPPPPALYSTFHTADDVVAATMAGAACDAAVMAATGSTTPPPVDLGDAHTEWSSLLDAALQLPTSDVEQRLAKATAIHSVVRRFTAACERLARVIIDDVELPPHARRIPPLATAGGVAGGEKYLVGNIFLKFARDFHGVYGSDRGSAKSANHELRSLNCLMGCEVHGLQFPLMVTVDYLGHRLCAQSRLAISGGALSHWFGAIAWLCAVVCWCVCWLCAVVCMLCMLCRCCVCQSCVVCCFALPARSACENSLR